ncbi:hypothetical protein R80B4_00954 [Fibrobacteres bacterium R8-0-B4]
MPPGRPRTDVKRQLEKGRLSATRKADRAPVPVRLNDGRMKMPPSVKADPIARAKWKELIQLFDGKEYVGRSDVGVITRFCLLCSEEAALHQLLDDLIDGGHGTDLDNILAVSRAVDTKRSLIRSLEDRLYLNPLAKMRGLPPAPKAETATPAELAGFGGV